MNHLFLRRLTAPLICAAVAVIPTLCGCAHADPPAMVAPAMRPAPMTIGGIKYDPAAPLDATVSPRFDEKSPPETALTYSVHFKGANGEVIPALLTLPGKKSASGVSTSTVVNASAPVPCVLLGHGINGRKEDLVLLAAILASKGYASFVMDTAGHGERPRINGKPVLSLSLSEFRTMCGQTVVDYRRAVDYLQTRPDIDSSRLGYIGVSLGGILGGVFVGDEPRLKTAVLWAAGGNWGRLMTTSTLRDQMKREQIKNNNAKGGETAETIEAVLADVDPLNVLPQAPPRPILFINGDKDTIVPTACTDELYARLKEPKKRIILPGGHIPDPFGMASATVQFLNVNLAK